MGMGLWTVHVRNVTSCKKKMTQILWQIIANNLQIISLIMSELTITNNH